jgi:hypothetical protein
MQKRNLLIQLLACLIFFVSQSTYSQMPFLRGEVKDYNNHPIPSATIKLTNGRKGMVADSSGRFSVAAIPGMSFTISAIGFADTIITFISQPFISIYLRPKSLALGAVEVRSRMMPVAPEVTVPAAVQEEMLANTFSEFGTMTLNSFFANPGSTMILFGPKQTINYGAMLPVMPHKEEMRGSRYLLPYAVHGVAVDQNDNIIRDSSYFFNYDKVEGKLMLTRDGLKFLTVDKDKIHAFGFRSKDSSFVFLNIPLINSGDYFLVVALGEHFGIYKTLSSRFKRSNYVSNGMVETGKNYDEYLDLSNYYLIDISKNKYFPFELKKKSLMEIMKDQPAGKQFLIDHRYEEINDAFLRGLTFALNTGSN